MVAQLEVVAGNDGGVGNVEASRLGEWCHGLAIDGECGELHRRLPLGLLYVHGIEPCNAAHAAEDHDSRRGGPRCTVAKLVRLQSVVDEVVLCESGFRVVAAQTVVG